MSEQKIRVLLAKPGLDGHSNGAEQIAVAARDSGIEVVYEGIRLTPARIANAALEEGVPLYQILLTQRSTERRRQPHHAIAATQRKFAFNQRHGRANQRLGRVAAAAS